MGCISFDQYNPLVHEIISVHDTEEACNEECGVCCLPNGRCVDTTQTACENADGSWNPGVTCEDVICPSPPPSTSPSTSPSTPPSNPPSNPPSQEPSPSIEAVCCYCVFIGSWDCNLPELCPGVFYPDITGGDNCGCEIPQFLHEGTCDPPNETESCSGSYENKACP